MASVTLYLDSSSLGEYQDKVVQLYMADSALKQAIPDPIRRSTEWLLRLVNCYYSNKIEGNSTHPKELLKTQEKGASFNQDVSKSILELLIHLEAQIKAKITLNISSARTSNSVAKFTMLLQDY